MADCELARRLSDEFSTRLLRLDVAAADSTDGTHDERARRPLDESAAALWREAVDACRTELASFATNVVDVCQLREISEAERRRWRILRSGGSILTGARRERRLWLQNVVTEAQRRRERAEVRRCIMVQLELIWGAA